MTVGANEIVGLLGDNGAGKSTLIKIVTGFHHPDSGTIRWKGERIDRLTVQRARELGIETVYQERALADQQSLWRNIFMGRERKNRFGLLDVHGDARRDREADARVPPIHVEGGHARVLRRDDVRRRAPGGRDRARAALRGGARHPRRADDGALGVGDEEDARLRPRDQGRRQVVHLHRPQHLQRPRGRRAGGRARPRPARRRVPAGRDERARAGRAAAARRRDRDDAGSRRVSVEAQTRLPTPAEARPPRSLRELISVRRYGLQLGHRRDGTRNLDAVRDRRLPDVAALWDIYSALMSTVPHTGIIALALTLVVIAGEIDLSFAAVIAVGAWVFIATGQGVAGPDRRPRRRARRRPAQRRAHRRPSVSRLSS